MPRERKKGRFHKLRANHSVTCLPKIGHDTETEAQAHIDSMVANGKAMPGVLTIYRCMECHKLHVGHQWLSLLEQSKSECTQ